MSKQRQIDIGVTSQRCIDVHSTSFNDVYLLKLTMPEYAFKVICGIFLDKFINCIFYKVLALLKLCCVDPQSINLCHHDMPMYTGS